jgi:hypothetical protein
MPQEAAYRPELHGSWVIMSSRTAILDASSAIILCKSNLHSLLISLYDIVLPESVYKEITAYQHTDAAEYRRLAQEGRVRVWKGPLSEKDLGLKRLDTGEYDVIRLYLGGMGDFVITDDGQAARYCKREGIPFINALLFPAVLLFARIRNEEFCLRAMEEIIGNGRYSGEVIALARECSKETIAFALPKND